MFIDDPDGPDNEGIKSGDTDQLTKRVMVGYMLSHPLAPRSF